MEAIERQTSPIAPDSVSAESADVLGVRLRQRVRRVRDLTRFVTLTRIKTPKGLHGAGMINKGPFRRQSCQELRVLLRVLLVRDEESQETSRLVHRGSSTAASKAELDFDAPNGHCSTVSSSVAPNYWEKRSWGLPIGLNC